MNSVSGGGLHATVMEVTYRLDLVKDCLSFGSRHSQVDIYQSRRRVSENRGTMVLSYHHNTPVQSSVSPKDALRFYFL